MNQKCPSLANNFLHSIQLLNWSSSKHGINNKYNIIYVMQFNVVRVLFQTLNWSSSKHGINIKYNIIYVMQLKVVRVLFQMLFSAGIASVGIKGFKDTMTHEFLHSALKTKADRLPLSMKHVLLTFGYIKVNYVAKSM